VLLSFFCPQSYSTFSGLHISRSGDNLYPETESTDFQSFHDYINCELIR